MMWILLPGFDGTGLLFAPLLRALPPEIEPVVVAYPVDRGCSAAELVAIVLTHLPKSEPYVLIAESFSGPIALHAAAQHHHPPVALVLSASFVQCPLHPALIALLKFCGAAPTLGRPPKWLVRWYLIGAAGDDLLALLDRAIDGVAPEVLAHRFSVLLKFHETATPPSMPVPLLYLQASKDRLVKARNFRIVQRRYPDVHLEKIDSPHLVLQVQPQAAIRAILQFATRFTKVP